MASATADPPFSPLPLPDGIAESYIALPSRGLNVHYLSSGSPSKTHPKNPAPLILLLHGFPELAFSWRHIMPALAASGNGYHVVAPDQRGYGRTTGWDTRPFHEVDLHTFSLSGLVADMLALVNALGYKEVECVVGHDFGAVSAGLCAMMRDDVFKSVIMMSHPFRGFPAYPFNTSSHQPSPPKSPSANLQSTLAALSPPRKHYKYYYSTAAAAAEMDSPEPEMATFLRGYFHLKSGDWAGNAPHPLKSPTAPEFAKMPGYYVMPLDLGMRDTVREMMASEDGERAAAVSEHWLNDADLGVYAREWSRTGFQGALNWYSVSTDGTGAYVRDMAVWAGRPIEVPSLFVSGSSDWGMYQEPGAVEGMGGENGSCRRFFGTKVVQGAGHWAQQEKAKEVVRLIEEFLEASKGER